MKELIRIEPNRYIESRVDNLAGGNYGGYDPDEVFHDAWLWVSEADMRIDYGSCDYPYLVEHLRYVCERTDAGLAEDTYISLLGEIQRALEQKSETLYPGFVMEVLSKHRYVSDFFFWRAVIGLLRCIGK